MQDCCLFQLIYVTPACPTCIAVLTVCHNISVASSNSLTDSDLQLLTETEQDRTRLFYTILPQVPQKNRHASKVNDSDSKIIFSICWSKAVFFNLGSTEPRGSANSFLGALGILKLVLFWVFGFSQILYIISKVPRLLKGSKTLV